MSKTSYENVNFSNVHNFSWTIFSYDKLNSLGHKNSEKLKKYKIEDEKN